MLFLLHPVLPLLTSLLLLVVPDSLQLQQDLAQNLSKLQQDGQYYISDSGSPSPSLQTVENDLQLFAVVAHMDLSQATYSNRRFGNHQVEKWEFPEGNIKTIYQIQSNVHLDTVVTQRYLDNRAPTQHRITNDFVFRTYAVSTATSPLKLYYLTEATQGLLEYRIDNRQVQIGYANNKAGLADYLPQLKQEVADLVQQTSNQ
ncbi:hypothetical protein [Pontibacter chitinilyticus]|uniref:hypothetical protein n=1 Tax=Pontibacter chitinilyticus TaxID=2674989 RepID=UPI00321C04BB